MGYTAEYNDRFPPVKVPTYNFISTYFRDETKELSDKNYKCPSMPPYKVTQWVQDYAVNLLMVEDHTAAPNTSLPITRIKRPSVKVLYMENYLNISGGYRKDRGCYWMTPNNFAQNDYGRPAPLHHKRSNMLMADMHMERSIEFSELQVTVLPYFTDIYNTTRFRWIWNGI